MNIFIHIWEYFYSTVPGLRCSMWDLPNPGIKPRSPALQVDSSPAEPPGKPYNVCN